MNTVLAVAELAVAGASAGAFMYALHVVSKLQERLATCGQNLNHWKARAESLATVLEEKIRELAAEREALKRVEAHRAELLRELIDVGDPKSIGKGIAKELAALAGGKP